MKDYHGTLCHAGFLHQAARLPSAAAPNHPAANPPPNQLAPLRLRQASSTTQLGTAPPSDAR
jgi:hypothetical protein